MNIYAQLFCMEHPLKIFVNVLTMHIYIYIYIYDIYICVYIYILYIYYKQIDRQIDR